jgi:hypothetical protein
MKDEFKKKLIQETKFNIFDKNQIDKKNNIININYMEKQKINYPNAYEKRTLELDSKLRKLYLE